MRLTVAPIAEFPGRENEKHGLGACRMEPRAFTQSDIRWRQWVSVYGLGWRRRGVDALCYIVPETSFRQQDGQHEWTAWETGSPGWCPAGFSGWRAVCFAVHFGIQTGSIG